MCLGYSQSDMRRFDPRWIGSHKLFPGFDERPFNEMDEEREIMGLSLPSEPLRSSTISSMVACL